MVKWVCTRRHEVAQDWDGTTLWAEVGWEGEAERTNAENENLPHAYVVTWPNQAWGFYSRPELARVATLKRTEVGAGK